ncbi:hypothetical protein [Burkholderia metallica]|uniref:hypothetical protein n=1 Tax=Burkholderia metallica TaxID=488729 RepID=UPI00265A71EC|nr:hypothetical protein [Burkholderia metallica]
MSSLLPLEQNDKYRRSQRIICAGAPHRECIRYATHSEFFTGSANTDRHDLPPPAFPQPHNGINSIANDNSIIRSSNDSIREFAHAQNRRQKHALRGPPGKAPRFDQTTIPPGEIPINRNAAINRSSSRFNKIERID